MHFRSEIFSFYVIVNMALPRSVSVPAADTKYTRKEGIVELNAKTEMLLPLKK